MSDFYWIVGFGAVIIVGLIVQIIVSFYQVKISRELLDKSDEILKKSADILSKVKEFNVKMDKKEEIPSKEEPDSTIGKYVDSVNSFFGKFKKK